MQDLIAIINVMMRYMATAGLLCSRSFLRVWGVYLLIDRGLITKPTSRPVLMSGPERVAPVSCKTFHVKLNFWVGQKVLVVRRYGFDDFIRASRFGGRD